MKVVTTKTKSKNATSIEPTCNLENQFHVSRVNNRQCQIVFNEAWKANSRLPANLFKTNELTQIV